MDKHVNKIFLFSLPRSGSTLLQRVLATHSKISSVSEPWFLLPFIYANKRGAISEYSHNATVHGITDLIKKLPNGMDDYHFHLKKFFNNIYDLLSEENAIYFLDKTPRYSRIISEISHLYPNAKFLFLFRNPVQVYGSMLSMRGTSRLNMLGHDRFYQDLIEGPGLLVKGYDLLKGRSYFVQYEKLIQSPEKYLKEVLDYLNLDYEKNMLENFHKKNLEGLYGDVTGLNNYNNDISKAPIDKWKLIFNTRFRRKVLINYIESLDENVLKIMGYDKTSMLNESRHLKVNGNFNFIRDYVDFNKVKFSYKFNRLSFD